MPRRLPVVPLAAAVLVVGYLVGPARGTNPADSAAPPAAPPTVVVTPADGSAAVTGTLATDVVPLATGTGTTLTKLAFVRRVTFQKDGGGDAPDTVQLADQSLVRGRVTWDTVTVRTPAGDRTLPRAEVKEIKVERPEELSLLSILLGLLTLTVMEIVLGVDNVIFLAIVAGKLPKEQQPRARRIGLLAALGTRILLLLSLSFLLGLTAPVFTLPELGVLHDMEAREVSWRDIILLAGGLFLIGKSVFEMHDRLEAAKPAATDDPPPKAASFAKVIVMIAVIDIVFSLDSVITAVGMVDKVWVMITAMVLAMMVMFAFAGPIARFVDDHPTVKVLALSFLILIGVMLVAEGLGQHMNKGYIYFAMAFGVGVEVVNMRLRRAGGHAPATTPVR